MQKVFFIFIFLKKKLVTFSFSFSPKIKSLGVSIIEIVKPQLEKIEGTADRRKRDRSGTIDSIQTPFFADPKKIEQSYDSLINVKIYLFIISILINYQFYHNL